jgi:hypothetical protein
MQQKNINKSKIPNSNNNGKNNIHIQNQGNKRPVSSNPIRKNSAKVKTNQINIPPITNSNNSTIKQNTQIEHLNINNQQNKKNQTTILKEQINDLISIYNAMEYFSQGIDITFNNQRNYAENILNSKYLQNLKLKEANYKLFQQMNSMENITNIDDYFIQNYEKIVDVCPKINNVIENMNDFCSNINYSLDRLYLNGNISCDENILKKNINETSKNIEIMNNKLKEKKVILDEMKINYSNLYSNIIKNDIVFKEVENKVKNYKNIFLGNNIESINQQLKIKNKTLLYSILND